MDSVSVNRFRDNLKAFVDRVVGNHEPIKVTRRAGEDFIVISAEDWAREQETLYVLQNSDLMRQIAGSVASRSKGEGRQLRADELDEVTGI